ncbi:CopG family antitoxin [Bdellovibrionota bacterium FG-2]
MAKNKISYAKKSVLDADEFDAKYVKILISIRLDGDVLAAVKAEAQKKGVKYQPLINQMLKERFFGKPEEDRIREIVREELAKTG